jgi:hypothetical protein
VNVKIRGYWARVLIDSGCLGNFLSPVFREKCQIPYKNKIRGYTLYAFDNQPVRGNDGRVTEETVPLRVQVGTHVEEMTFDITKTSTYDAVFGLL